MVSGEGAGTGDCSGATGGVITSGDDGNGSGEGEGAVSDNGGAGAAVGDVGAQPAANSNSKPRIIPTHLIFMPTVQKVSTGIISHNLR